MTITTRKRATLALLLAATPLLALGLSGCAGAASADQPSSTPSASTGSLADYRLKLAECLRENGVDASDPDSSGTTFSMGAGGADALQAAMDSCRKQLGDPPAQSEAEKKQQQEQEREANLKMAQCYRDNGVDVSDPQPGQSLQVPSDAPQSVQDECGGSSGTTAGAARG
jgi:hypothetical protein